MTPRSRVIGFINIGHLIDHMVMLIFPTAVLGMQTDFAKPYSELIALALGGFIMFGAGSLPAGWLGDRWSRRNMMAVFFLGIGLATIATGFTQTRWQLALGLAAMGLFAAIYHPVGTAMLVGHAERVGRAIGVNGLWGNLGVAFAAIVTGAVTQWLGWRWAFILPGSAALCIGAAYLALVPPEANRSSESSRGAQREFSRVRWSCRRLSYWCSQLWRAESYSMRRLSPCRRWSTSACRSSPGRPLASAFWFVRSIVSARRRSWSWAA